MKPYPLTIYYLLFTIFIYAQLRVQAQQINCVFKDPAIKIDFSKADEIAAINVFPLPNYSREDGSCPIDGTYSFVSETRDCFGGDWLTFREDHTPGDKDGKMMLVNASPDAGIFFKTIITGLRANTTYEFAAWMTNVCRISGGCPPLPPNISIKLLTADGQKIVSFQTGLLTQNATPKWRVYSGLFTTPGDVSNIVLTMEDVTIGGCGNDFALDDITFRECVKPVPEIKPIVRQQKKPAEKNLVAEKKPVVRQRPPATQPLMKKAPETVAQEKNMFKNPVVPTSQTTIPPVSSQPVVLAIPKPISTRANPLVKQIQTEAGEIKVELYDNGEVDGDTVTIYDNNKMIISRAGLSTQAVTLRIKVDKSTPEHELIMVANNLGSIPPNTSTMVITTSHERYEVFISSSEQKNAKIKISLKD